MKNSKIKVAAKAKAPSVKATADKKAFKKNVENHKKAAAHLMKAAEYHLQAAKYYEAGNSEKAAHSSLLAHGHRAIAGDFLTDDAKHHAQALKQTNYHF